MYILSTTDNSSVVKAPDWCLNWIGDCHSHWARGHMDLIPLPHACDDMTSITSLLGLFFVNRALRWPFLMDFKVYRDSISTFWIFAIVCGETKLS